MANEDYKNNPLYSDITKLDHLSPQPTFGYEWNSEEARWEPAGPIRIESIDISGDLNIDLGPTNIILEDILSVNTDLFNLVSGVTNPLIESVSGVIEEGDKETHRLLSGISGELSNLEISGGNVDVDFSETNRLLSGISGELSNLEISGDVDVDFTETNRLLSGISGELSNIHVDVEIDSDTKTHELLSGILAKPTDVEADVTISRSDTQPWKLRTKTVNQKIEEDFFLMEDIPEDLRYGIISGECFGKDKNLMDDVFGTYFRNARTNISEPETGHPDYFIHAEYTNPNRCIDSYATFHSDTLYGIRQENVTASLINSYELQDYNSLYERGLVDHIVIYNESSYPIQFHTADRRLDKSEPVSSKNDDLIYLDTDIAVKIDNDEAGRIFVKRPHTISGYTVKYSVVYKETGAYDVIE